MLSAALVFIVLGILVKYGNMYFLIAGYNTMSKKKKAQYDINGIAAVFGNVFFGMALIIISGHLISQWLDNPDIEDIAFLGSLLIGIPYLLIKSNSDKYKRKNKN